MVPPVFSVLNTLVETRRVLITVGAGGVGKTTTAAALGLAGAQKGKRVLCLTIDPARRLAESLGLERMSVEKITLDNARLAGLGVPVSGSLSVMMLDTKRTFDDLVRRRSSSAEKAERLLRNPLYQYVSTSLAGTQEYMAMEKLVAVKNDPSYDLVVLDTPPTANALDFLDAPGRLIDALDSAAMRWFVQAFEATGKVSLNLLARSAARVLRTIGRITGGEFVADMAQLIVELNELFGGFKERAQLVQSALRSPEVAFVLVTSPAPVNIHEILFFSNRLEEYGMPRGAFVVNRVHIPPGFEGAVSPADVSSALSESNLSLENGATEHIMRAHADAAKLADLDAHYLAQLEPAARSNEAIAVVRVPEFASDIQDLRLLSKLTATLMNGGV